METPLGFEDIWQSYRSSLKWFLQSKVANQADVDDLLQDILIKTYNNLHTLKEAKSAKAWLFQIANHTIIDFYRKSSAPKPLSADDLWYNQSDDSIRTALEHCIEPFIKALPEESANLLIAIDLKGKAQKELAEEMNISYSTLKSRVQKSRMQLLKLFEDCCHFVIDSLGNITDYTPKNDKYKNC